MRQRGGQDVVSLDDLEDAFGDENALLRDALATRSLTSLMPTVAVNRTFALTLGREVTSQNQASSGRCWIFANINAIRRVMIKRLEWSHDFTLSPSYIYFYSMLEQCNTALEVYYSKAVLGITVGSYNYMSEDWRPTDGGDVHNFLALLQKYGAVPSEVYPDTHHARNSRVINDLIKRLLHLAAIKIFPDNGPVMTRPAFDVLKRQALGSVHRTLSATLGRVPAAFEFVPRMQREGGSRGFQATSASGQPMRGGSQAALKRGKHVARRVERMTPLQFYVKFVRWAVDPDRCVHLANDPRHDEHTWIAPRQSVRVLTSVPDGGSICEIVADLFWNVSCADLKAAALRCLRSGRPVIFACDVDQFYSERMGYLGLEASSVPRLFPGTDTWDMASRPHSKGRALSAAVVVANHEMCFIGYDVVTDTWEVENSWGASKPITMTGAWFERFVYSVCVWDTHLGPVGCRLVRTAGRATIPIVANSTAGGMPLADARGDKDCG